ncbi:hypothetical protein O181_026488 [Austropuccinia psidii MF-1]|uniref:Uncharacterized protein n=1 Tax=Austropuccinia psidii MF-1 TaxID=1389203 RepID=A0A9Q3H018_9BASI|nr:hypothetical protein [Austropuccinia psidii MF-1]
MGNTIIEHSDEDQDSKIGILSGLTRGDTTRNSGCTVGSRNSKRHFKKNLFKHTRDAQTFLVTQTRVMEYLNGIATKINVCIVDAQHPLIPDSGAHCSIVTRD